MLNLSPQKLTASHFLAKALRESADHFQLGKKTIKLDLSSDLPSAAASRVPMNPLAASKLGRSTSDVEAVAAGIESPRTLSEIRAHLDEMQVPTELAQSAQFFLVESRRRRVAPAQGKISRVNIIDSIAPSASEGKDFLSLRKQVPVEKTANFILGIAQAREKVYLILIDGMTGSAIMLLRSALTSAIAPISGSDADNQNSDEDNEDQTIVNSSEAHRDFAECYQNCMENTPAWMITIAAGVCAGCVTAIGVAAADPTKVTSTVAIGVCAGCAAAVGVVLGNCLLTCHEMIGT